MSLEKRNNAGVPVEDVVEELLSMATLLFLFPCATLATNFSNEEWTLN